MATVGTAKQMASSKPGAATYVTLYTVPALTQTEGTVYICNQGISDDTFRVRMGTPALGVADYRFFDKIIRANESIWVEFCLDAGQVIEVGSTNGYCSFVADGLEFT